MNTKPLIADIDAEIARLQQAKTVLLGLSSTPTKGRGRPKGSLNKTAPKKRRKMSAESRARIAAAQRKRWAAASNRTTGANK